MTLVNTETGELLDAGAAERRAMKISLRLDAIADNFEAVMPLIREAIELRDDITLGYRSPGDYVSDRFGQALGKLGMELRREVVRELTDAGMSTRAIGPVVSVSEGTVRNDLKQVRNPTHLTQTPQGEATDAPEVADRGDTTPNVPRPAVTGIDGKNYTRPTSKPRQAQRDDAEVLLNRVVSSLDSAARDAAKLTPAQIARVTPKAALWVGGLRESLETLQRLLTSLTEEK